MFQLQGAMLLTSFNFRYHCIKLCVWELRSIWELYTPLPWIHLSSMWVPLVIQKENEDLYFQSHIESIHNSLVHAMWHSITNTYVWFPADIAHICTTPTCHAIASSILHELCSAIGTFPYFSCCHAFFTLFRKKRRKKL